MDVSEFYLQNDELKVGVDHRSPEHSERELDPCLLRSHPIVAPSS